MCGWVCVGGQMGGCTVSGGRGGGRVCQHVYTKDRVIKIHNTAYTCVCACVRTHT